MLSFCKKLNYSQQYLAISRVGVVWFTRQSRTCNGTVARCDFIARFSRAAKPRDKVARVTSALVTLPARTVRHRSVYVTIRCLSVCQSVCLSRLAPRRAAGLLLWARRPGDIDRLLHVRRSAAAAPQQTSCSECHVVI